jgi:hypothetical protein
MDKTPQSYGAGTRPPDDFEKHLLAAARTFPYPPTPNVSQAVLRRLPQRPAPTRRTLAAVGIFVVLILAILFAVPQVRAAVLDWIRIGAVRIFFGELTSTPTPTPLPAAAGTPEPTYPPTSTPLSSILDLSGETTLALAQRTSGLIIRLPAYPPDLGPPDHVFFQDLGGPVVFLVWAEPGQPQKVRMSLSESLSDMLIFQKIVPNSVEDTRVNGQPALWVDSPYFLISGSGSSEFTRLVPEGHTLVWTQGSMTYRLETASDLSTAIRVAESLK